MSIREDGGGKPMRSPKEGVAQCEEKEVAEDRAQCRGLSALPPATIQRWLKVKRTK